MPFPEPPYPGWSWPLTQHIGRVTSDTLFQLASAAERFREFPDPDQEINNLLHHNRVFPPNIRADSGQIDIWRDYRQVLSELGLMFSKRVRQRISLTPVGLAYLDGALSFSEMITFQVLRYQYPNAQKSPISRRLRSDLGTSNLSAARSLPQLQEMAGVRLRPAVLIWDVLRALDDLDLEARLDVEDIQRYLLRCYTHADTDECLDALVASRGVGPTLPLVGGRTQRRNVQDWIKLLLLTPLFSGGTGQTANLRLSQYGVFRGSQIDAICVALRERDSFWLPGPFEHAQRQSWFTSFGAVDISVPLIPDREPEREEQIEEYVEGTEPSLEDEGRVGTELGSIDLQPYMLEAGTAHAPPGGEVTSTYDRNLTWEHHRLHDELLQYIAKVCVAHGAQVFTDPASVDLLVVHGGEEFLIEAKSVTPRNFTDRVRYAVGQVSHYEFLRKPQSRLPLRRVVAVPASVPPDSWSIEFLVDHLGMDFLTVQDDLLTTHSDHDAAKALFRTDLPFSRP